MRAERGAADGAALALFFAVLTALTVGAFLFHEWRPPVASQHGKGVDTLITYLLATTGLVFILGHAVLAWFLWKNPGEGPSRYKPVRPRVEWLWALAPAFGMALIAEVGVFFLSKPVWAQVYGPPPADAVQVEVVGKQFEWLVRYAGKDGKFGRTLPERVDDAENPLGLDKDDAAATDDIVLRGSLHLPAGRAVFVRLRSHDVLHSFSIPLFRVKQDVVPGMSISVRFTPETPGTYEIACAELCGLGHYKMRGFAYVKGPEEFQKWMDAQEGFLE